MAFTNQWHGLVWPDIQPSPDNPSVLVWQHGLAFWVFCYYSYLTFLLGVVVLWRKVFMQSGKMQRQSIFLIIGTLIPIGANTIYLLGYSPVKGLDLTPFAFAVSGLLYAITIFQYRFMDIVPVARGALVERMPDGIVVLNEEGVIADFDPAAREIGGKGMQSGLGQKLGLVWPQLDVLRQQLEDGQHTEMLVDGAVKKYLDVSLTEIKGNRGKIAGQLIMLRDITERREIEQTLRESEARYEALVEQSNEGVLIVQNGEYRFANRTMEEILGYGVEEIIGQKLPFGVVGEEMEEIKERYDRRQAGEAAPSIYGLRLKRKDGGVRDIEINVGTISYEGKLANIVTLRDVTERKLAERKLEELYQEEKRLRGSLQEEIEKRSKYTRALVHELNTPLTSILASSELLETEVSDDTLQSLVQNIRRSSQNLEQRIGELIDLARGEVGMSKINAVPLDLGVILKEIVSEMKPVGEGKGLKIELELEQLPEILGDRSRLRQVMSNLLNNAIKFTVKGGVKVRGKVYDQGNVLVEVEDSGRGMEEDEVKDLFDPYRRKVRAGERLSGLGIGLALARQFVELHRGQIWVTSQPGKGSIFRFTLPVGLVK